VRELGKKAPVDERTLFMVASNTKPLTTLLLAKLVEEGKFSWETPVTAVYPTFRLGSAETTASIRLKHLVCACTGTPRNDWNILEIRGSTPKQKLDGLASFAPTSELGEMFQYSDLLVAAAGFIGGHVAYPELELGAAYDKAMQTRVLGPLGMTATTLDHRLAQRRPNRATAHTPDRDGKQALSMMELNDVIIAQRPAGGAWSNVRDMLKYVQMELANGSLPDGKRYIAAEPLLARRAPQVSMDEHASYALGLVVERRYGVQLVYHGGDVVGYHSGMVWFPEHGVGGCDPHEWRSRVVVSTSVSVESSSSSCSTVARRRTRGFRRWRSRLTRILPKSAGSSPCRPTPPMRQSWRPLCERRSRRALGSTRRFRRGFRLRRMEERSRFTPQSGRQRVVSCRRRRDLGVRARVRRRQ
jgi:CubicO group peptidase (beta-lactamase class C family)